jgi:hypothetical protein
VDSTDTVNLYVLRQQSVTATVATEEKQAAAIDMIYARRTTPIYNVTGNKDTIHVIVNEKDDPIYGYRVRGKTADATAAGEYRSVYDWTLLQQTIAATDSQPRLFSFNGSLITDDGKK